MLDVVAGLKLSTRSEAKFALSSSGHLNRGTQKALDSFYNQLILKNGTRILLTKRNRIMVKSKTGQIRSSKGLGKYIKQFKEKVKK